MRLRLNKSQKFISKEKKDAVLADFGCSAFCKRENKIKILIINVTEKKDDENNFKD